jgi:hypothetical protein
MRHLLPVLVLTVAVSARAGDSAAPAPVSARAAAFLADAEALRRTAAEQSAALAPRDRADAEAHQRRLAALEKAVSRCGENGACASLGGSVAAEARAAFGANASAFSAPLRRLESEAEELSSPAESAKAMSAAAAPARDASAAAGAIASLRRATDALGRTSGETAGTLAAFFDNGRGGAESGSVPAGSGDPKSRKPLKRSSARSAARREVPLPTLKQLTQITPPGPSAYDAVVEAEIPTPAALSERLAEAAVAPLRPESETASEAPYPQAKPASKVHWDLQVFTGDSVDAPTPLTIHQNGQPDIHVGAADYYTSPWAQYAPYYAWRVGRWNGDDAWEFEHIHNKMFLSNLPPDVQQFQLTHGYNYVLFNRAHKAWGFIWRVGAGAIVTHPEIIVRGQSLSQDSGGIGGGYFLCGVGAQAAVEKRFYLNDHFYGSLEAKVTAGYADVPIVNGDAQVPALTLHGLFGIGAEF